MLIINERLPENAIIVEEPEIADLLSHFLKIEKVINKRGYKIYISSDVLVSTHGVGGPSTALILEELIENGVRKIIRYGTAGTKNEKVKLGSYFIPTGVSRYISNSMYQRTRNDMIYSLYPDLELAFSIYEKLKENNIDVSYGEVFQSDDFYAEEEINEIVDMETGTLFLISKLKNVKSASVLIIANYRGKWINYEEIYKRDFPIILNAILT
ncbi:hypothetical protein [Acidianus manzaensis]|nr:hypothetical protein [Acidianus manzaensis]